jgi:hypothetical protein
MKTAEEYRTEAQQHRQDSRDSWERSDTDGFLSQWASGINAQVAEENAKIADAGGLAIFERTILVKLDGSPTDARMVRTRYGTKWRLDSTDEWITYKPERESTLKRRGYREETIEAVAPAKAITWAPRGATGLGGAHQVRVIVVRTDDLAGRRPRA